MNERYQREAVLGFKFAGVSLLGFAMDFSLLHLLIRAGLEPAWARVVSLLYAMHVTFAINGLYVFMGLDRACWGRQWASYMATNGFGNFCNYWIFVTLVSTHWPVISLPAVAISVGSGVAWAINYAAARLVVFRRVFGGERRTALRRPASLGAP